MLWSALPATAALCIAALYLFCRHTELLNVLQIIQSHWAAESAEAAQTQLRDVRAALTARERLCRQQERELQAALAQSEELSEHVIALESELAQRSTATASAGNSYSKGYHRSPRISANEHGVDGDGFLLLDAWQSDSPSAAVDTSSAAVAQRNSSTTNISSSSSYHTAAPVSLQQAVAGSPMLNCDSPSRRAANNSTSSDWSNWQQQEQQQREQQQQQQQHSSVQVPAKHMSSHFSDGAKSALTSASGSEWAAPADARRSADWLRRTSLTAATAGTTSSTGSASSSATERQQQQQQQQRGHTSSSNNSVQHSGDSAVQTLGTAVSSSSDDAQRYSGASTADLEHELMLVNMERQQVCVQMKYTEYTYCSRSSSCY
jgi:hypothetical protein